MQRFDSDGIEIAYIDEGEGDPVLLIHGFATNVAMNWVASGWVRALTEAGYRVVESGDQISIEPARPASADGS